MRRAYLLPVRMYRRFLSPLKPVSSCRFTPSCSRYAIDAVMEWGIFAGSLLALWRILRCNPFSRGGDDPVPTRAEVWSRLRSLFRR
ncbi:MAG: membrane protein insertion efficiency factor YidD [Eubacteriales bacterium]